jgi:hypothetical protein
VFVTHDMAAVERFCDRAILLDHGRIIEMGEPAMVARRYNEVNFRQNREHVERFGGPDTLKAPPVAELRSVSFARESGETVYEAFQGEPLSARLEVYFHSDAADPIFAIGLTNEHGVTAFAATSQVSHGPTGRFRSGTTAFIRVRFENWLAPGLYHVSASIGRDGDTIEPYDAREDIGSVFIHASGSGGGAADLPHTFSISRS